MIVFDQVSKTYPDGTVAVGQLSFEAATGQITVLVGPSGCGKTTSIRYFLSIGSGGSTRPGAHEERCGRHPISSRVAAASRSQISQPLWMVLPVQARPAQPDREAQTSHKFTCTHSVNS